MSFNRLFNKTKASVEKEEGEEKKKKNAAFNVLHKLSCEGSMPTSVTFSQDGTMIASGDLAGIIRIWNVVSGSLLKRIQNVRLTETRYAKIDQPTSVDCVAFSPDGRTIISIANDEPIIKFWDIERGTMLTTLPTSLGMSSLVFTPDGTKIIGGYSSANHIDIWDVETRANRTIHSGIYRSLQLSPDGTIILQAGAALYNNQFRTWSGGNHLKLIDVQTGTTIRVIEDTHDLQYASISSDNKTILYTNEQGELKVCNADGTPIKTFGEYSNKAKFRADGGGFVSCGKSRLQLWNTTDNVPIQTLRADRVQYGYAEFAGLIDIDINKDDTKIAAACTDHHVYIFTDLGVSALKKSDILINEPIDYTKRLPFLPREMRENIADFALDGRSKLDPVLISKHYRGEAPFTKTRGGKRKTIKGRKNKSKIKRKQSKKNKK
jgi:WD40 repeat protein